jgi:hypothetical protein
MFQPCPTQVEGRVGGV